MPSRRSILLLVVILALAGGGAMVGAVLARHPIRFLAGRAYRSPEAKAELRQALEARREELARALQREGRAVQEAAALPEKRAAAVRALTAGQELASVASALAPLLEEARRPAVRQRLGDLRRSLADLDRLASRAGGPGAWDEAARDGRVACATACLAARDRCWAAAGPDAPRCEGVALDASGCVARCR